MIRINIKVLIQLVQAYCFTNAIDKLINYAQRLRYSIMSIIYNESLVFVSLGDFS